MQYPRKKRPHGRDKAGAVYACADHGLPSWLSAAAAEWRTDYMNRQLTKRDVGKKREADLGERRDMADSVLIAIEGLPSWFGTDELENLCKCFGTVLSTKVVCDTTTHRSLRLGFVRVATTDAAQRLLNDLHAKAVSEHILTVTIIKPKDVNAHGT